jgi:hypothetical protein
MSHNQNASKSHNIETANAFFENVAKLKCVGALYKNYVHNQEQIEFGECLIIIRFGSFQSPVSYF